MDKKTQSNENRHHILYKRDEWISSKPGTLLRKNPAFIVPLDREIHAELHRDLFDGVPVLGLNALKSVCYDLLEAKVINNSTIHPVDAIDSLQLAIEHIPRRFINKGDRELGRLAIQGLEEQVPYIKESIEKRTVMLNDYRTNRKTFAYEKATRAKGVRYVG